jgi:hypothetical protein
MKIENIVGVSFIAGAFAGIVVLALVVFFPLPSWHYENHFATYPDTCSVNDLGNTTFQVYCPE